jgi:hypothetical protein
MGVLIASLVPDEALAPLQSRLARRFAMHEALARRFGLPTPTACTVVRKPDSNVTLRSRTHSGARRVTSFEQPMPASGVVTGASR